MLLQQRLDIFFGKSEAAVINYPPLKLNDEESLLNKLFTREDISIEEKVIFLIAFVPHVQPNFFDNIIQLICFS